MNINSFLDSAKSQMEKAVQHMETELTKVRAGKVTPSVLDGITVDYYGTPMPVNQVANVNSQDAKTLVIQPWEKTMLGPIEKALMAANLGGTPQNDGSIIRLIMPPLTEERRKDFVKKAHTLAEAARVSIRNIRRETNEHIRKLSKDNVSEDDIKGGEAKSQDLTNKYTELIDKHLAAKEKEIMTV